MKMKVPWWRKVLDFALGGIRSGFGLFSRNGHAVPQNEVAESAGEEERPAAPEIEKTESESEIIEPDEVQIVEVKTEETAEPEASEPEPEDIEVAEAEVSEQKVVEPEVGEADRIEPEVPESIEERAEILEAAGSQAEVAQLHEVQSDVAEDESAPAEIAEPIEVEAEIQTEAEDNAEIEAEAEITGPLEDLKVEPIATELPEPEATESMLINREIADTEVAELKLDDCDIAEPQAPEIEQADSELANSNEEDETLKHPSPQSEIVPPIPEPAEEPVLVPEATANQPAAEDAVAEQSAAPLDHSATEAAALAEQPSPEPTPPSAEDVKPSAPAALTPAPQPVQQSLPLPELTPGEKTAVKVAAMLKARGQDAEDSPFSVIVSQVYDGPLDLLLDLIRKQDIDIYDIPIAKITAQFLAYVDHLRAGDMDVAGEFIYTAALLIHIKSKLLLPRAPSGPDDLAEDPRRELVERLLEHERFKNAAQMLHERQMLEAASWTNPGVREFREDEGAEPEIAADTTDLVRIFRDILERARNRPVFNLQEDTVTVGQMIQFLARRLTMEDRPVALRRLLSHTNSERALVAMFLALLEMVRLQAILLRQDRQFSEIFIKKHAGFEAAMNQGLANARDDWR